MQESSKPAIVAIDALGGDDAPRVVLEGVGLALEADPALTVLLVGPDDVVTPFARSHERCKALLATEAIAMDEHPAQAVRTKRDSSIVVGCKAVRTGEAGGFFSAGSTGACMMAATLHMGSIKRKVRPALATVLPHPLAGEGVTVIVDVGANADWRPEFLVPFALMGAAYATSVLGMDNPRIALLNIGAEETKGSTAVQEAHKLLVEHVPGFVGNAEGGDLLSGRFDVIVTDGYTGNIALKAIEGVGATLFGALKEVIYETPATKIAGAILKPHLKGLAQAFSSETIGAAPLMGVKGVCMIGHGSSSPKAIASGIATTATAVRMDLTGAIATAIAEY